MNDQAIEQCRAKAQAFANVDMFERSIGFVDRALDMARRTNTDSRYDQVIADLFALRERVLAKQEASQKSAAQPKAPICDEASRILSASCFYAALGVDLSVTQNDLKTRYHALAKKFHPDKHSSAEARVRQLCEDAFKQITEAFDELSDENKRRRYDVRRARDVKRARDEPEPQTGSKQRKVEPAPWYSKFWHTDPLPKVALSQSDIAGFCVRQMIRLAKFMDENGDEKYDWLAMLGRYDQGTTTRDNFFLERVLWNFEGFAGYLTQVQELKRLFRADDYPRISVHLDHLEEAITRYMHNNAAREPAALKAGASLEEACTSFVDALHRLCVKMSSMQDRNAPWDELLTKFPNTGVQAAVSTLETVGVEYCDQALRDIMATTNSHLVKSIATKLITILGTVGELQVKARTGTADAALEKARILREDMSMEIAVEITRDYSTVKKVAQMLPAQIAINSKLKCRDDILRYFCQTFKELSLARRVWKSMISEASESSKACDRLRRSLKELVAERDANTWRELLSEKAGSSVFQTRFASIKKEYAEAVAYDGSLCKKTEELYREIRTELLIYIHEAQELEE